MAGLGFGIDLSLKQRRTASVVQVAAITSLTVLGAAPLPDGADAAVMNGCAAVAVLPDTGASFVPGLIVLTVSDPGFDGAGNATSVTRTITGTAVIRRQYPNQAQRLNAASAGVRTVHFALTDEIYQGTTIVSAVASAGFHGAAVAGVIVSVTNGSTLAYPRPMFAWLNMQHERATGTGFAVEGVAYHRHARGGQQVACIQYRGRDAQATPNLSAAQTAATPSLSDFQAGGQRVEAWKATLPLASMTQGDLCQVNAIVYPWIGDAASVLDTLDAAKGAFGTLTAGSAVNTAQTTPLRFVCDKTAGYGGGQAWVKAGASGGTVGSSATPYATVQAALTALAGWNGANRGHADHSGATVWLMDDGAGGAVDHLMGGSSGTVAGKCWTDIRVDAAAVGQVRLTISGLTSIADLLRFRCPMFVNQAGNVALQGGSDSGTKRTAFDAGFTLAYGQAPGLQINYQLNLTYWRNVQLLGSLCPSPFHSFGGVERCASALVLGCTGSLVGTRQAAPYAFIGNLFSGLSIKEFSVANTGAFAHDGGMESNNLLLQCPDRHTMGQSRPLSNFARVQNVYEQSGYSNSEGVGVSNDGQVSAIDNFVSMHNTIPGVGVGGSNIARENLVYADVAGAAGVQKRVVELFDLIHQRNVKTDTYTTNTTVTGRTGNWKTRYLVGAIGLVVVTGDAGSGTAADPSGGNWLGEVLPPSSAFAAGEANVTFVNNKAGTAGAGGGNYALTGSSNAAYGRVPVGRSVLGFDLVGNVRRSDGSGAAGAYERTIG